MGYYGYGMSAGTSPKRTPVRSWPSSGTSSRFQPRGFPESIDPNNVRINGENRDLVMEAVHGAATLPGTVMDRPLAVANQVANRLTGTPAGFKGPIEQASDFVNSLPVVGDIVRGAGTAMRTSGEFTAALFNSQIASGLKMTATSPDGANAGAAGWFNRGFGGELDILAELLGQRYKGADKLTVGDLRQMALERGFSRQDIADLASGKKGIFDFGGLNAQGQPYKINQAPLIDLAGRIAFDPLNAAIVVGPARLLGAAEKIPGVNRVLGLTRARDLVLNDPAIKAVLDGPVLGVREGVKALQMGTTAGVTNRSVGLFLMGMSKGGGALLNSYVKKVAVPTTIGQVGVNVIDHAINGDEAPSGPFAWLWQLGRDIRDDKPLSNGMLFNLWSVMHFPATAIVQGYTKPAYRLYRDKFPKYRDIEVNLVDLTLKDVPEAKGLPYAKRRQMAMDRIPGGEANFWAYVDFLGQKHHAQFIALNEIDRVPASNMPELQMSAELAGSLVRNRMRVKADEFGGREAVEQAIDWSTGSRFNANKSLRKVMGGLRAVFNADRMWAQWGQWLSVASQISRSFAGIAPVVPAFQKTLIKERIQALREQFRDIADVNDGMIPASEAVRLLMDHPALIEHQGGFWGRMIVRDSRPVKFSWVEQRLKAAEKDAFSMHEVIATDANWGKLKDREAATRRNIRRPDGSLDLSLLETRGNVRVYVSTADDIARRDRLDMPDRLTDALSARANGTSILDDETIFGLRMAGYKVRSGKDGISIRDGGLAPGKEIVLAPSVDTQTAAQIAAHLVKRSGNDAPATLIADEAAVMAQGLKPNAVQLRWDVGKMDDLQRQGAIEALNEIANVGWADDTVGVLYVVLKKTDDIARLSDTASARLGAIFPDRAPDGLFRPESGKAWMQTIRDTSRSRSGRPATGARPLGDERTVADVAKHGRLREDWWAGEAELARIDERRLAGVARQPGPDAGPVGQEAGAGTVGRVTEDLDRGQVTYALDPLAPVETNFGSPFDTSGRKREGDDPFEDNGVREKIIDSPTITASERDAIRALQEDLFRNNPTYTLEVVPKGGTPYRYGEHPFADMVIDKQVAGDSWQMRWGGPVGAFQRIVFGKVYTRALQDDMKQEWFNKAINAGATPAQANGFLAALDTASEKVNILFGGRQARGDLLDPKTIKNIALGDKHGGIKVIRGFNGFDPKVIKAFGGPDGVVTALGESSSRIMRKIEQAHRASDGTGAMGRLLDTMYGQAQKGFRGKTGKSLSYLRTFYPLIRFKLSIRWQAMNKYEANIIGAIRHGAGHGKISKADKRAMERFSGTSLQDDLASGWLDQRDITDIMANSFREERLISAEDVVVNLASDSIALKALRERVGMIDGKVPTARQLAEELDRMMYGYDKVGVKRTVTEELDKLIKQDAQFEAVRPLVERLTDINRKQWEGLFNGFRGNVNRSNIERTLNSYFLFWPISYQLKVAKLLTDVLTKRSFGRQTDLLGAWTMDRMWQEHVNRLVNDPEYVQMFKENPTLWLMAGMMFPILPMDAGITESRLTRYVQSNVGAALGFWEKDERYPDNPVDMAVNVLKLGMAYDLELAERAAREMFKNQ